MIELKLKKTKVQLYSSIKDLPIERYNEFTKLSMIDLGVGSQISDFNKHFTNLHAYLKHDKREDAIQEVKNLHNNFFNIINKVSIWSYCFAPFIKSIDGEEYNGTELEDHKLIMKSLSDKGLTVEQCQEVITEIKGKLLEGLNSLFLIDSLPLDKLMSLQR